MLKHCRPDILARGHLSLLHRHLEWQKAVLPKVHGFAVKANNEERVAPRGPKGRIVKFRGVGGSTKVRHQAHVFFHRKNIPTVLEHSCIVFSYVFPVRPDEKEYLLKHKKMVNL